MAEVSFLWVSRCCWLVGYALTERSRVPGAEGDSNRIPFHSAGDRSEIAYQKIISLQAVSLKKNYINGKVGGR
jgi:hypothetical protein